MKKVKKKKPVNHTISNKIIAHLRKASTKKVVDISEIRNAKIHAKDLEKAVIKEKELAKLDPLHGVYAYAQNKMSVLMEQLGELSPLSKLIDAS